MSAIREIRTLSEGGTLSAVESEGLFNAIFQGSVSEIEIAAAVVALKVRRETSEEILGAVRSMRTFAAPLELGDSAIFDTCGTGGDHSGSFNVSSAGRSPRRARRAHRQARQPFGFGVKALGPIPERWTCRWPPADAAANFKARLRLPVRADITRPWWHRRVRKNLGVRTIFNYLGPLTQPGRARAGRPSASFIAPCFRFTRASPPSSSTTARSSNRRRRMDESRPSPPPECYVVRGRKPTCAFPDRVRRRYIPREADAPEKHLGRGERGDSSKPRSPAPTPLGGTSRHTGLALFAHRARAKTNRTSRRRSTRIHGGPGALHALGLKGESAMHTGRFSLAHMPALKRRELRAPAPMERPPPPRARYRPSLLAGKAGVIAR